MELRPPEGVTSDRSLSFTFSVTNPADVLQQPPVELKFPVPFRDWTGNIPADLSVEVQGRLLHYQASALRKDQRLEEARLQPLPVATPAPKPHSIKESLIYVSGSGVFSKPKLAEGEAPPFQQAVDQWICGEEQWVLYDRPTLLLQSTNRGQDWQVVRKEFSYRPCGLACWSAQHIVVWGTKSTGTPERGIPFVIEESPDGGKHWQPIKGRLPIDYLLGVAMKQQIMSVIGIRLPKTGLPEGKDWFELPRTSLTSEDGIFFTEMAGPNFFDDEIVEKKSVAPNNTARAYVLNGSFRGTSFVLYAARTPGEIPEYVASCTTRPDIAWSGNSRIVALQTNGVFMAYGDLDSRPFAPVDFWGAPQDKDTKIKALLKANQ